jgi:chitinase
MGSLNRDQPCGPNVVSQTTVFNSCSGISHQPFAFSRLFAGRAEKPQRLMSSRNCSTVSSPTTLRRARPIWRSSYGYARDDKVVWHGYVFQVKWWSQGVAPGPREMDNARPNHIERSNTNPSARRSVERFRGSGRR